MSAGRNETRARRGKAHQAPTAAPVSKEGGLVRQPGIADFWFTYEAASVCVSPCHDIALVKWRGPLTPNTLRAFRHDMPSRLDAASIHGFIFHFARALVAVSAQDLIAVHRDDDRHALLSRPASFVVAEHDLAMIKVFGWDSACQKGICRAGFVETTAATDWILDLVADDKRIAEGRP